MDLCFLIQVLLTICLLLWTSQDSLGVLSFGGCAGAGTEVLLALRMESKTFQSICRCLWLWTTRKGDSVSASCHSKDFVWEHDLWETTGATERLHLFISHLGGPCHFNHISEYFPSFVSSLLHSFLPLLLPSFWDRISHNPGWLQILCVAENDFKLLILLLLPPKMLVLQAHLGIELQASCVLGEHSVAELHP